MFKEVSSALRPALVLTLLFAGLLGIAYPAAMTGLAQVLFPRAANGSLVSLRGRVVGSALIGQGFAGSRYFHPRPSAAGKGYDATASSGSNLGPASKALADRVTAGIRALAPTAGAPGIPADLVTTSASGLDPDISPAAAYFQVARVAGARHVSPASVRRLVDAHVDDTWPGFLGEPHVNVLELNLALDAQTGGGVASP
ncbi:MAG: potassium-transporting ATPase subunit KdpC [Sphingomonadales bacterium]|nr:potassium-transporting ATPase subunit KdpC [Sphingomonadales bacterium]